MIGSNRIWTVAAVITIGGLIYAVGVEKSARKAAEIKVENQIAEVLRYEQASKKANETIAELRRQAAHHKGSCDCYNEPIPVELLNIATGQN